VGNEMQGKGISVAAVICAAGTSSRMGSVKKEFLPLKPDSVEEKSLSVLGATVSAFASCPLIGSIVICLPSYTRPAEKAALSGILDELRLIDTSCGEAPSGRKQNRILFVKGGPTRRVSVYNALSFLETLSPSYVLIHDGARPWIKRTLIEKVTNAAIQYGAAIPAIPLTDTPKELSSQLVLEEHPISTVPDTTVRRHLRRTNLCGAQTPQGFKFPEILRAHEKAAEREKREKFEYTDDAEIWGEFIGQVAVISGDPANRKITYPEDLIN